LQGLNAFLTRYFVGSINNLDPRIYFLDAPGGTGKTFVFNTLLSHWRAQGKVCVAVASSGIAAILLKGGKRLTVNFKYH